MATTHIVGAGLAGLSCAIELVRKGRSVALYEQAARAGGRARSFHDAALGCEIDNGNHLILSGNTATLAYLDTIGARDRLFGPGDAVFPFIDVRTGARWKLHPNRGYLPWWIFSPARRAPGTTARDYWPSLRMLFARREQTVASVLNSNPQARERYWDPFIVAVLNAQPEHAAAILLRPVILETLARGAGGCRPLIARDGLSRALVDPALEWLGTRGATIQYGARVTGLDIDGKRVRALRFSRSTMDLGDGDSVVVAVPPPVAMNLVPGLKGPDRFEPILNVHFRLAQPITPRENVPLLGLIGGTAHWIFMRGDVASVTISAGTPLVEQTGEAIASATWTDVARALDMPPEPMPRWRVIKERRATFLQTPSQCALRPGTKTQFRNLMIAGDWTDTGLPATIESAIRSGRAAAGQLIE